MDNRQMNGHIHFQEFEDGTNFSKTGFIWKVFFKNFGMICILRWNGRIPSVLLRQGKEMALMTNGWKSKNEKSAIRPIDVNYHYVLSNRLLIISSLLSFTLRSDAKSKNKRKFEIRRWEGRGLGPVIGMLVGKGIVLLKRCEDASKNGLGWLGTD